MRSTNQRPQGDGNRWRADCFSHGFGAAQELPKDDYVYEEPVEKPMRPSDAVCWAKSGCGSESVESIRLSVDFANLPKWHVVGNILF